MKALCIFLLNMLAWTVLAMIVRGGLDGFNEHTWSTILIASLSGIYIAVAYTHLPLPTTFRG
ncbi:hypothetical protein ACE1AJ_04930 [Streptococcus pneumoniae]